jgi:CheY-specific phosphatase CheX
MNNAAGKILYQKAALIFEELCFLMPCSSTDEWPQAHTVNAAIPFRGPSSGRLLVSLDPQTLSLLTSTLVGDEEPQTSEFEQDALREIANVLCGNALPALFGNEHQFLLGIPALIEDVDSILSDPQYPMKTQAHITFDSGHASIALLLENNTPPA